MRAKGIDPKFARRCPNTAPSSASTWVVEQTIGLLHWFRCLRMRWEIRDDIHESVLSIACSIICWRRLKNTQSVPKRVS